GWRGGRKAGTGGRACCASGRVRRGRYRGGRFFAGIQRLAQQLLLFFDAATQVVRACGARQTSFASVGQQILRACGAQDDKLARSGEGKKRNTLPPHSP